MAEKAGHCVRKRQKNISFKEDLSYPRVKLQDLILQGFIILYYLELFLLPLICQQFREGRITEG